MCYLTDPCGEILLLLLFLTGKRGQLPSTSLELAPWKGPQTPESFTRLVNNVVTNVSSQRGQPVTNKIILSRGHKLISIHLGHSLVAFNM